MPSVWSSASQGSGAAARGAERHATWLELFFDLVFAGAIAEAGGSLAFDFDFQGLARFALPFALIWWAWAGHTLFATRFDPDDTGQRLLTVGQVFLVAVMAANAQADPASRDIAGFAAAYAGMRLLLALQYARVPVGQPAPLARRYGTGIAAGALLWLTSAFVAAPARYGVWLAAGLVEAATPLLAERGDRAEAHPGHLPERFGLFTLIVLGESVAGLMAGLKSRSDWSPAAAGAALTGLALTFVLWWIYFDRLQVAAPRSGSPRSRSRLAVWLGAHLPLCFGMVVVAIGIRRAIQAGGDLTVVLEPGLVLAAGTALVLIALVVIARADWNERPVSATGPIEHGQSVR